MRERITYEILEDGYMIYLDGNPWVEQREPYIPFRNLSYEEGCLKQIDEIVKSNENQVTMEDRMTDIELALVDIYESQL